MSVSDLFADFSLDRVWQHLRWIEENAPARLSGTPHQERAGEYFAECLDSYGLEAQPDSFTAYRSVPLRGSFRVQSPFAREFPCEPCGHIASTPDEGLEAEVVYVGPGDEGDYAGTDVAGVCVLTEISAGSSRPEKARIAAGHGAAVIVFINWGLPEFGTIPCGAIKCAWGNPTRKTIDDVPRIAALAEGPVHAHIVAQATQDRGPLTQPWSRIRAPNNSTGDFLLVGGHYDAWKPGMTDNAAGNALKLELARIFSAHRESLQRDIVFAFWNGHEIGDYEGSTWFGDRYWDDLDAHAVAYFNVDSVGFAHSSFYLGDSTPELTRFHQGIERQVLGVETGHRHLTRDNEHPFFGLGLPALEGRFHFSKEQIAEWGDARGGWWWHSVEDTLDKIDRDRYRDAAHIYATYIWEMCTSPILPMDFSETSARIARAVTELKGVADGRFELELPVSDFASAVDRLGECAASLGKRSASVGGHPKPAMGGDDAVLARLNRLLMSLSRTLLPAFETAGGRYEQDRYALEALGSAIPALHGLHLLAETPPDDELSHLLYTDLLRQRNRLSDALRSSTSRILENIE